MTTNRLDKCFDRNTAAGRKGLLPYFTAGFPDLGTTEALIRRADGLGVTAVEIGVPYSDSIADGPVIQSSFHAALANGFRLENLFELAARVRPAVECGLVAMVSYSIVHRTGTDSFMANAAEAGFDGIILPDVPVEESQATGASAARFGLHYVGLIAPNTSAHRLAEIAQRSTGFVYQIATAGTTGERSTMSGDLRGQVERVRLHTDLPICVGFGVSQPEHVRSVCEVADGAIVGSAIVRRIADGIADGRCRSEIVESITETLRALMTGVAPAE